MTPGHEGRPRDACGSVLFTSTPEAIETAGRLLPTASDARSVAWLHQALSEGYAGCGNQEAAIRHREEACRAEPGVAMHPYNLACALHRAGNPEAALAEVRKAADLDRENEEIAAFLGQLLVETGAYAEGERILRGLLESEYAGVALIHLVHGLIGQNRIEEAVRTAEAWVAADPEDAATWAALSLALGKAGESQRAA